MNPWLTSIPLAYLLGSIPFGYLLVRFIRKQDIRATGSGNIGATNVLRSGAKGIAVATLLLDLGKAYLAVIIARHLAPDNLLLAVAAAAAAVLGHVFPVWLGFRGGKGVASGLGISLALVPWAGLSALGLFILILALTRYVSLASILATASMPLFALIWLVHPSTAVMSGLAFISLLICVKHHANIGRLVRGTEPRIGGTQ